MSMSEYECMHDCTCCATSTDEGDGLGPVEVHCDLPGGHAFSPEGDHWDPLWGWWSEPRTT